jgi:hypothetical protein
MISIRILINNYSDTILKGSSSTKSGFIVSIATLFFGCSEDQLKEMLEKTEV